MNDEIKEILDYFKDDIEFLEKELINTNFLGRYITIRDKECGYLKKLLDYITNLQQINNNLTTSLNKKIEEGINLQQENERLKLEIERLNDVLVHKPDEKIMLKTNDGKELFIIQSERIDMQEELNKANMQLMTQLDDYKSRCEKANNFIEENWISYKDSKDFKEFDEVLEVFIKEINELYNILNGRSE